MPSLGEALREARAKTGMSLLQVSKITGITNSRLSRMEHNKTACSLDELKSLIDCYGTPAIELFLKTGYLTPADLQDYARVFDRAEELLPDEREQIQRLIDLFLRGRQL